MTEPVPRVRLGSGGEFDLIRRLLGPETPLSPGVVVGPGDDCAVLEDGLAVSVDLSVEGVHFRRDWLSLEEVGFRATAAALSDLAAMAARPLGVLLALAVEANEARTAAPQVQAGSAAACRQEGVQLIGGDVARSSGPLFLDVVVLGRVENPVLRNGCRPGDEIWVTGSLGCSAAAVILWERGLEPPAEIREAFARPRPRIREALWLNERIPLHGLIDLSDGLRGDVEHMAAASDVSSTLVLEDLPVHPGLHGLPGLEEGEALRLALSGGEDYELCFTAPPGAVGPWADAFEGAFGTSLTRVGRVGEGRGVLLLWRGREWRSQDAGGFSHFGAEGTD